MHLILLGTGCPIPLIERAGPSQLLVIGEEKVLIDCGPGTTYQLIKAGVHPAQVKHLFFTHHHMDHDVDFPHFLIASWALGRRALKLFGPRGTKEQLDNTIKFYQADIRYRMTLGRPEQGIFDVQVEELSDGSSYQGDSWWVEAMRTRHVIYTLAYRFTCSEGSIVFSGDTAYFEELADFASGADILVQDCCMADPLGLPEGEVDDSDIYKRYKVSWNPAVFELLHREHCTPYEAGMIADKAGVKRLILTHLMPFRALEEMRRKAQEVFKGEVIVGEDLMSFSL